MTALYHAWNPTLVAAREHAKDVLGQFNAGRDEALLRELFGALGDGAWVEPPFFCDYGSNTFVGRDFYANTGCVFLDCARIEIGDRVLLGPRVQLLAATHPIEARLRAQGYEYAEPIAIGDDAWLGGGVIVLPGVTIGARAVVGAGSVVTRDVPADTVVAGNPARMLRSAAAA